MSFQFRPWELIAHEVDNHFEGRSQRLQFLLRGTRVVQITTSSGWLTDRVRFGYDSFRRQRLITPYYRGRATSWLSAVTVWLVITHRRQFLFWVDSSGCYLWWLLRVYNFVRDPRGRLLVVSYAAPTASTVYHGSYGLPATVHAELALPVMLSYEEQQTLIPPAVEVSSNFLFSAMVLQLFKRDSSSGYHLLRAPTSVDTRRRRPQSILFQVSPLQLLLSGGPL